MTKRFVIDYNNNGETFWDSFRQHLDECPSEALKMWAGCNADSIELHEPLADKCLEWLKSLDGSDDHHAYSSGPFLVQDVDNEPEGAGPEGFTVYHMDDAGQPATHKGKGGVWFFQPDDYDGDVWSDGYDSKAEAWAEAEKEGNEAVE